MIKVRDLMELRAVRREGRLAPAIAELAETKIRERLAAHRRYGGVYNWRVHGYIVVLEECDDPSNLRGLSLDLLVPNLIQAHWINLYWHSAQSIWEIELSGRVEMTVLVQATAWLDPTLKARLEGHPCERSPD